MQDPSFYFIYFLPHTPISWHFSLKTQSLKKDLVQVNLPVCLFLHQSYRAFPCGLSRAVRSASVSSIHVLLVYVVLASFGSS